MSNMSLKPSTSHYPSTELSTSGQAEATTTSIELSLSCLDLPNCDIITKSDPQIIVYQMDVGEKGRKIEIGRTEVIQDNLNPKFVKKILIQYHFEQIQKLRFEVYDIDPIKSDDFMGAIETTLAEIVTSRSFTFKQPLIDGPRKRPGYIVIDAEELTSCKQVACFGLKATDLASSFCGLLSPSASIHIYRATEGGSYTIVHRTPVAKRNCNPHFKNLQLKLTTLCGGDMDRTIRLELIDERFNFNRNLGFFETNINSLKGASKTDKSGLVFDLMNGRNRKTGAELLPSKVVLTDFRLITQATFLDYIRAGAQIHFVIAIDFTASNGDPNYPDSLHYLDRMGKNLNPYEASLIAVGNILKPYDEKGMFAGFGFGAKLFGPNRAPSHLFPLNGNEQHPYVNSVDELVTAYRSKLSTVILSGPTNFAPCIAHCNRIAKDFEDGNHYFVLLIVTDGIISDMMQTKRAIIEASRSPMSIIICGVGDADFAAMDELDSDDKVMSMNGQTAERDIVQFVPMKQFLTPNSARQGGAVSSASSQLLAEEVLREIPDQLTGYMVSRGFHPELTYANH